MKEEMKENKILNVRYMSNSEANRITKESICLALLTLMDTKDFEKISITEIVKKAGVSRQSFYRNYTSKEDIVIEIEEEILSSFSESLRDPKYRDNLRLWLHDFFQFIDENQNLVRILDKAGLSAILFSKAPFIVESGKGLGSGIEHYFVVGALGALNNIALSWLSSGMKESYDVMADICMRFDPGMV